jgi:hypothetical protein
MREEVILRRRPLIGSTSILPYIQKESDELIKSNVIYLPFTTSNTVLLWNVVR